MKEALLKIVQKLVDILHTFLDAVKTHVKQVENPKSLAVAALVIAIALDLVFGGALGITKGIGTLVLDLFREAVTVIKEGGGNLIGFLAVVILGIVVARK